MTVRILPRACSLLAGIFLLSAAAAGASQDPRFAQWDKDNNRKLTHAEFYEGINSTGIFSKWDTNSDGLLDRQEMYAGTRQLLQQTGETNRPSQAGLAAAGEDLFEQQQPEEAVAGKQPVVIQPLGFGEADLNRDGTLDKTEFFTALFRQWDSDKKGFLRMEELNEEVLQRWLRM